MPFAVKKQNTKTIMTRKWALFLLCSALIPAINAYAHPIIGYTNITPGSQQNNAELLIKPELIINFKPGIPQSKEKREGVFLAYLNGRSYTAVGNKNLWEKEDKALIRREWAEFLGFDVFMPYFKAKEAEEWVSEKAAVHVYKIKGKPKFDDNKINYIFKTAF
ncbi:MAG: hypothetical protein WBE75_04025 [Candidatus Omnitrophota bacterium]|jgi:hypothetical protein